MSSDITTQCGDQAVPDKFSKVFALIHLGRGTRYIREMYDDRPFFTL
jgi:hypothetical protein